MPDHSFVNYGERPDQFLKPPRITAEFTFLVLAERLVPLNAQSCILR